MMKCAPNSGVARTSRSIASGYGTATVWVAPRRPSIIVATIGISQLADSAMLIGGTYICAHCGQRNEIEVDVSASRHQRYTEDCQVCCQPNLLVIEWEPDGEAVVIEAERENG